MHGGCSNQASGLTLGLLKSEPKLQYRGNKLFKHRFDLE